MKLLFYSIQAKIKRNYMKFENISLILWGDCRPVIYRAKWKKCLFNRQQLRHVCGRFVLKNVVRAKLNFEVNLFGLDLSEWN